MHFPPSKLDQPWTLALGIVATGVLTVGVIACGGREAGRTAPGDEVEFKVGRLTATYFRTLAVVQDRLWVTTNGGIAVIDPVAETWAVLALGSNHLEDASVIPCGSGVWLLLRDGIALVNLQTSRFQLRRAGEGVPTPLGAVTRALCGGDGLWLYAYFLAPRYAPTFPPDFGLFRFDPSTSRLEPVELPGKLPVSLDRWEDGLLVQTRDSGAFVLKGEGQTWVAAPKAYSDEVLSVGDSVVWVGASYDVSPASYFVLRYIRDVREPKDLVILSRGPLGVRHGGAVHNLGMLWAVSEDKLLRIDPTAQELVTYALTDSSGRLAKKSFHLKQEGGELLYFDGNTVRRFSEGPEVPQSPASPESTEAKPASVDSTDLGKKSER